LKIVESWNWNPFDDDVIDIEIDEFSESCESLFGDLDDYDYCETTVILQTQLKPNDGFILSESASNAPGANYSNHLMKGSNHLQMRNDDNTEVAMRYIFEQGCGTNNSFFKTEYR